MKPTIVVRSPLIVSDGEFGDFVAMIKAGGEVTPTGLEKLVCAAEQMIFLRVSKCLAGIAALKNPRESHRTKIAKKSGVRLPPSIYRYELGWVFVLPSYRQRGFANILVKKVASLAGAQGVYSTTRTDNAAMFKALRNQGFGSAGTPYKSDNGDYKLQLFLREPSTGKG